MNEAILVIIKPDGMIKGHAGHVLSRFEETDLVLIGTRLIKVTVDLAKAHYTHLKDAPFFDELIRFLTGQLHNNQDKVLAMVFQGADAVKKGREIAGATNPELAQPHSIRGSLGRVTTKGVFENVIHVSSDVQEGEREIKMWFLPEEILTDLFLTKTDNGRRVWA
ncbi:MAG: nucleoside-diphosphate kinase [Candidatus Omnitrophota bacterium]